MAAGTAAESVRGVLVGEARSRSSAVEEEMLQCRHVAGVVAELGSSEEDPRVAVGCCSCNPWEDSMRERSVEAVAVGSAAAAERSRAVGGFGRRLVERSCSLGCSKESLGEADAVEQGGSVMVVVAAVAAAVAVAARGSALPFARGVSWRLEHVHCNWTYLLRFGMTRMLYQLFART